MRLCECILFNKKTKSSLFIQTFAKCFLKHIGFLDDTGNFAPNDAVEKLTIFLGDKGKAEEVLKDCQATDAVDKDTLPLTIYKCYVQHKLMKQE